MTWETGGPVRAIDRRGSFPVPTRFVAAIFFADDAQHFQSDGAGYGITAEGVEIFHAVGEGVGDGAGGDHDAQWVPVADGFADGHDVGHDAVFFESPKMAPVPPATGLYLVCDIKAAGSPQRAAGFGQVARRQGYLPAAVDHRFADKRRWTAPFTADFNDCRVHMTGVFFPCFRGIAPVDAPVGIGHRDHVNERRHAFAAGAVEFVRTDVHTTRVFLW